MLIFLFPVGVYLLFKELRDEHVFVIIYSVMASYFAGVMVRLMLTLTPVVCVTAAIAVSTLLETYLDPKEPDTPEETAQQISQEDGSNGTAVVGKKGKKAPAASSIPPSGASISVDPAAPKVHPLNPASESGGIYGLDTRALVSIYTVLLLLIFVLHCTFVTSTAYSSPSVVLASRNPDGSQNIIDDFREAYYWLRQNTASDAKVMSWWDYGYQISGMADRPTLVDNNTWNNTHIATVGKAMCSNEERSYPILKQHDVDYILVIFGGLLGYSGDDINKYLWMIRIAQGVWPDEVKEADYFTNRGEYKIDDGASKTMKESLMYKMSYFRFNELFNGKPGMDRVRGGPTATVPPTLDILDEAFTSENWIVSITDSGRKISLLAVDI